MQMDHKRRVVRKKYPFLYYVKFIEMCRIISELFLWAITITEILPGGEKKAYTISESSNQRLLAV